MPKGYFRHKELYSIYYRPEFSLFVGDLSDEIDDLKLYGAFRKYSSCHAAKVVLDQDGRSKGYGFVRFTDEMEQQRALLEMQHAPVGRKPIRVSLATPKRQNRQNYDPYGNYNNYYHNPQGYYQNWHGYNTHSPYYNYHQQDHSQQSSAYSTEAIEAGQDAELAPVDEMEVLEDPGDVDIEKENEAFINDCDELYHAMEESRWCPLDSLTSVIQDIAA